MTPGFLYVPDIDYWNWHNLTWLLEECLIASEMRFFELVLKAFRLIFVWRIRQSDVAFPGLLSSDFSVR